ncbi:8171_t:CDS:1, partial [Funneliformis caledonium]
NNYKENHKTYGAFGYCNIDHPDTCDNCKSLFSFFDQLKEQLGSEFNDMLDNYQIKLIS